MNNNQNSISSDVLNNNSNNLNKKIQKSIKKPLIKNPGITHFNIDSHFIYDLSKPINFITTNENKNLMKLNESEFGILENEINKIEAKFIKEFNFNEIDLPEENVISINKYFKVNSPENEIVTWVKNKINTVDIKNKISCRKLSSLYSQEKGKYASKNLIHNILKNKIGLKYLKTKVKNSKITEVNQIYMKICFIKIIARAIKVGYEILFMDESSLLSSNNNYRCWRNEKEQIYFDYSPPQRSNLLLIVNSNSVIYYKINKSNTNEEEFLKFMQEFLKYLYHFQNFDNYHYSE